MNERRDWPRFCPTKPAEVAITDSAGAVYTAALLNESLGGAAFSCAGGCVVVPGTIISIDYRGAPVQAIVWHRREDLDGTIVFGVEWLE